MKLGNCVKKEVSFENTEFQNLVRHKLDPNPFNLFQRIKQKTILQISTEHKFIS